LHSVFELSLFRPPDAPAAPRCTPEQSTNPKQQQQTPNILEQFMVQVFVKLAIAREYDRLPDATGHSKPRWLIPGQPGFRSMDFGWAASSALTSRRPILARRG